ncbi:MAG: hypothetical protein V3U84_08035 [Thiotrichaceae bacterium]
MIGDTKVKERTRDNIKFYLTNLVGTAIVAALFFFAYQLVL